jgi:hypothetical protein
MGEQPACHPAWLARSAGLYRCSSQGPRAVEDAIRTGKDCGIGKFPSCDFAVNSAWLTASLTAATLLAWLKLLAFDGDLARAEPKTLRYRILHAAGKLARSGRRRWLKIPAAWPWADAIATAWARITAMPQAP